MAMGRLQVREQVPGLRIPPAWGCRPYGQPEVSPAHTCIMIFAWTMGLVKDKIAEIAIRGGRHHASRLSVEAVLVQMEGHAL